MKLFDGKALIGRIVEIIQLALGGFILFFMIIGTLGLFMMDEPLDPAALVVYLVIAAIGALFVFLGYRRHALLRIYKRYSALLGQTAECPVSQLAAMTNSSEEVVEANLEKLIHKQYFGSAYLDHSSQCIVFPDRIPPQPPVQEEPYREQPERQQPPETAEALQQKDVEYVSVICESCGGLNKVVKGKTSECEYCGMTIKGE